MKLNKENILNAFKYAFENLYEKDKFAIENNSHEQCITGRLAMYLREYFTDCEKDGLRIDVEYNRDESNQKLQNPILPYNSNTNPHIRPDILFHMRGDNSNNIIYCEIKKDNDSDERKVRNQVNGNRYYKFGVVVSKIKVERSELLILEQCGNNFEKYIFTPPNKLKKED